MILGPAVTLLGALIAAYFLILRGRQDAKATFAATVLAFRIRQVEDFYAPALLDVEQSQKVYNKLRSMLNEVEIDASDFRLLDHIYEFNNNRKYAQCKPIITKILEIGQHLTTLIQQHAGLIEGGLTETIIDYKAHFEILNAASQQKPTAAEKEAADKYGYYPRLLNRELAEGYKVVLRHLETFLSAGDRIIAGLFDRRAVAKTIQLGKNRLSLINNLTYYEKHARRYAQQFDHFDISPIRQHFCAQLPERAHILDVGAGSGRDLIAFLEAGYSVETVDASPAMLRECRSKVRALATTTGNPEISERATFSEITFDEITFEQQFDGVWAASALLHVPRIQITDVVTNLVRCLRGGGRIYMSFKYGIGEGARSGRLFTYYNVTAVESILRRVGGLRDVKVWLCDNATKELRGMQRAKAIFAAELDSYDQSLWLNVMATKAAR